MKYYLTIIVTILIVSNLHAQNEEVLENANFKISVNKHSGSISSFQIKKNQCDLVTEKQLQSNFRICLPLPDYQANYIEGMEQSTENVIKKSNTIEVRFSGMSSAEGEFPIDLSYTITLQEDYVSFKAKLTNHYSQPISEFWFPRIGGWKQFGNHRDAKLATPNYNSGSSHDISLFRNYPGSRGLGAEAAEWSHNYPGMVMPWWDIYDEESNSGLYLAYHDTTFRLSTWHTYLMPNSSGEGDAWLTSEKAAGQPVGLIFSHVRYPFIHSGEILEGGEFIIRVHEGDWHQGSQFYRKWFMTHFPFDNSNSWLRKKSAWFTSIIYQPEDKIIADYKTYNKWTEDAQKFGINCFELIGWDSGGLERDYPIYKPIDKLGGREGFQNMLQSIDSRGGKCLIFNNYNILDQNTDWYKNELNKYKQIDGFGQQNIWMGWGESTLLARKSMNVRYHVRSSVTPEIEKILADQFVELVEDGAHGFQIDKVCVGGGVLDFNPLNTLKPDVALHQGLVDAIDRLNKKCLAIDPDFQMASEFGYDRLLPYFDVGYRNAGSTDISTFKYVFPEWTSCIHISAPRDFKSVNGAAMTGAVMCIEPDTYQGTLDQPLYHDLANYIREVENIRRELADIIFLGNYYDNLDAQITKVENTSNHKINATEIADPGNMPGMGTKAKNAESDILLFKVHGDKNTNRRAIVVVNVLDKPVQYKWKFTHKEVAQCLLYEPFRPAIKIDVATPLEIKANGLQILVEE